MNVMTLVTALFVFGFAAVSLEASGVATTLFGLAVLVLVKFT